MNANECGSIWTLKRDLVVILLLSDCSGKSDPQVLKLYLEIFIGRGKPSVEDEELSYFSNVLSLIVQWNIEQKLDLLCSQPGKIHLMFSTW